MLSPSGVGAPRASAARLGFDIILGGNTSANNLAYGDVYIASGITLNLTGGAAALSNKPGEVIWGPGIVNAQASSRWQYPSGAGAGAAAFLNTGGLEIDGQALACKGQPGAGGITIACNLSLNAALLDTNAGATSGCTFVAGGASFCNFGP